VKLQVKSFEKIAIVYVSGGLISDDADTLDTELVKACSFAGHIVLVFTDARPDKACLAKLSVIAEKRSKGKPRFVFVSSNLPFPAAPDLVIALDYVNTMESGRIVQLFAKELELIKLKEKLEQLDVQLSAQVDGGKLAPESAVQKVRDQNKKLQHLHKVWRTEIDNLRKHRARSDVEALAPKETLDTRSRINEAEAKALELLSKQRLLG
jgi:hypothetical protein